MSQTPIKNPRDKLTAGALCLGNFDGVHLGHQSLILKTIEKAEEYGGAPVLATFSPHPREFFNDKTFDRIYPEKDNERIINELGLSEVFYIDFNSKNSSMNPTEFLNYLYDQKPFKSLIVGYDFKFGNQRSGGAYEIKKWCSLHSIEFYVLPKIDLNGEKISSTSIRECLKRGDFKKVKTLMGRSYSLTALSYKDQGLGKTIGFPTLNFKIPKNLVLKNGVYAVTAKIENKTYKAIANLGFRPTVDKSNKKRVLEVHLINVSVEDKAYEVMVTFNSFIRDEMSFTSLEELKKQIELDLSRLKNI